MHAFVNLKLIDIDPNKIGIYLTETEFDVLLIILVDNLIYDYVRDNSEILFSTNEVRFQLGSIVILHIYIYIYIYIYIIYVYIICFFYLDILGDILRGSTTFRYFLLLLNLEA